MKHFFTAVFFVLLFSGCGVTIKSVVDSGLTEPYENPLIVIPYERYKTENFSSNLKKNLEAEFSLRNQKVEVLLVRIPDKELALNRTNNIDKMIGERIMKDRKDLIIYFKPDKLQYYNGGLQSASYQLIGIDVQNKREIWKANFESSGSFGPSTFAKESAKKIVMRLQTDRVLN